jgi:hypothetical protein
MPEISFLCVEIYPDRHVTGRNCGAEIRVGYIFTAIARIIFPPSDPGDPIVTPPHEFVAPVALRLETIKLYGRRMDFLSPGVTALLGLSGAGFELLSGFLADAPARTYYSLGGQ